MRDHDEVGRRIAHWLRQAYPRHAAKLLQTELGLTPDIAERALQGKAAQHTIERMIRQWGQPFQNFIYEPLSSAAVTVVNRHYWVTSDQISEAAAGLDIAARDAIGLPATSSADHAEYARRNLGWVSLSVGIGAASLAFHDAADPAALARAQDWVAERAPSLHRLEINGQVTPVTASIAELGRRAIAAAAQDSAINHGWQISRESLSSIAAPTLRRIVSAREARGRAPGTLPRLLSDSDSLRMSAMFRRLPDRRIFTLYTGAGLGINPTEAMGRELSERSDRLYADNLRHRLEGALVEPTFHRLKLRTAGRLWLYESLASADAPSADGSQLIGTTVNIIDSVAA